MDKEAGQLAAEEGEGMGLVAVAVLLVGLEVETAARAAAREVRLGCGRIVFVLHVPKVYVVFVGTFL